MKIDISKSLYDFIHVPLEVKASAPPPGRCNKHSHVGHARMVVYNENIVLSEHCAFCMSEWFTEKLGVILYDPIAPEVRDDPIDPHHPEQVARRIAEMMEEYHPDPPGPEGDDE